MTRLSEFLHNSLSKENLDTLFSKRIFTITDFIDSDAKMITKLTNLTYKEVLDIRKEILTKFSAKVRNGTDYYNFLIKTTILTPTNIDSLDILLEGGLLTGSIYEFCGLTSTGKTQICLTIATNIAYYFEKPVYYIDTKRDFSTKQIQNILEAKNCKEECLAHILNRIKVKQVNDQHALINALYDIKNEFVSGFKCPLIIIDSLPAIFYHIGDYNNTVTLINYFVNIIRYLSVEYHTTVIVTNIMIKDTSSNSNKSSNINFKPGLGNYWHNVPNTRILLTNTDESMCKLTVMKSSIIERSKNCNITITVSGVM